MTIWYITIFFFFFFFFNSALRLNLGRDRNRKMQDISRIVESHLATKIFYTIRLYLSYLFIRGDINTIPEITLSRLNQAEVLRQRESHRTRGGRKKKKQKVETFVHEISKSTTYNFLRTTNSLQKMSSSGSDKHSAGWQSGGEGRGRGESSLWKRKDTS